jgi:hypothetical protein
MHSVMSALHRQSFTGHPRWACASAAPRVRNRQLHFHVIGFGMSNGAVHRRFYP